MSYEELQLLIFDLGRMRERIDTLLVHAANVLKQHEDLPHAREKTAFALKMISDTAEILCRLDEMRQAEAASMN